MFSSSWAADAYTGTEGRGSYHQHFAAIPFSSCKKSFLNKFPCAMGRTQPQLQTLGSLALTPSWFTELPCSQLHCRWTLLKWTCSKWDSRTQSCSKGSTAISAPSLLHTQQLYLSKNSSSSALTPLGTEGPEEHSLTKRNHTKWAYFWT